MTRTGEDYLDTLRDGRHVVIDGEPVKDLTAHPAFGRSARSSPACTTWPGTSPTR